MNWKIHPLIPSDAQEALELLKTLSDNGEVINCWKRKISSNAFSARNAGDLLPAMKTAGWAAGFMPRPRRSSSRVKQKKIRRCI